MAIPVNKRKISDTILANIPDNDAQFITAEKLRNTLDPIVNSTFGYKTIWSGWMWFSANYDPNYELRFDRTVLFLGENYYDPNYFPALDPNNLTSPLADYQQAGCRYKLISQGSNITSPDGTYPTSVVTDNGIEQAMGLTFDVKISGGSVVAIKVNNPGTGYASSNVPGSFGIGGTSSEMDILVSYSGGGSYPRVRFDLSRVINMDKSDSRLTSSGVYFHYLNLFIPSAGTSIGGGPSIHVCSTATEKYNISGSNVISFSEPGANFIGEPAIIGTRWYNRCAPNTNFTLQYPTSNVQDPSIKGYYTSIGSFSTIPIGTNTGWNKCNLEIKVPIINTTI